MGVINSRTVGKAPTFTAEQEQELTEIEDKLIFDNTLDKSLHDGIKYIDPDLAKSDPDFYVIKSRVGRGLLVRNIKSTFKLEWFGLSEDLLDNASVFNRANTYLNLYVYPTLIIPSGTYKLQTAPFVDNMIMRGYGDATVLESTVENEGGLQCGSNLHAYDFKMTYSGAPNRSSQLTGHRLVFREATNSSATRINIQGGSGTGIFIWRCSYIKVFNCTTSNTLADGCHVTGPSHNVDISYHTSVNSGDDGIAVVSYLGPDESGVAGAGNALPCSDVTILNSKVRNIPHGRGITVVGGVRVTIRDCSAENVDNSGLLITSENSYFTTEVENIVVDGFYCNNCGSGLFGGVIISGREDRPTKRVSVKNLRIFNSVGGGLEIGNNNATTASSVAVDISFEHTVIVNSGRDAVNAGNIDGLSFKRLDVDGAEGYGLYARNIATKLEIRDTKIKEFNRELTTFKDAILCVQDTVDYLDVDTIKVRNTNTFSRIIESVNAGKVLNVDKGTLTNISTYGVRTGDVITQENKITSANGVPTTGTWQVGDVSYELDGTALCHRCTTAGEFGTATLPIFVTV